MTSRGRLGRCVIDQIHVLDDAAEVRLMVDHRVGSTRPRPRFVSGKGVDPPFQTKTVS